MIAPPGLRQKPGFGIGSWNLMWSLGIGLVEETFGAETETLILLNLHNGTF